MNNFRLIWITPSILWLFFCIGCVGPPETEYGLVENFPVVINTQNVFTYSLNGGKISNSVSKNTSVVVTVLSSCALSNIHTKSPRP